MAWSFLARYSSQAAQRGSATGVVPPASSQRGQQAAKQAKVKDTSKELQLRPRIAEHDLATKLRKAEAWLEDGLNVNLVVLFKDGEQSEAAAALCDGVQARLEGRGKAGKPRRLESGAWRVTLRPVQPRKPAGGEQQGQ